VSEKLTFTGRTFELTLLDRQYAEPLGALCVVYGRRRVGKTRLLTHWLANRDIPGFYWLATDSAPGALLRSLSQALYRQLHGQAPADPGFTYYDWDELLRELARLAGSSRQKQVIILDEFTYALDAYPDLAFKLQIGKCVRPHWGVRRPQPRLMKFCRSWALCQVHHHGRGLARLKCLAFRRCRCGVGLKPPTCPARLEQVSL
jgi:AAA+ ATPase superfamily predicted ATPase